MTAVRIPNVTSKILMPDGTMNRDWYQYLQLLGQGITKPTVRLINGSVLTGSIATYYTSPTNTAATITAATLTNTTAGTVSVSVYLVPQGGTAGPSNILISAHSITAGNSYTCPELINQVVERGGAIQAVGNGVTFVVSGTLNQ